MKKDEILNAVAAAAGVPVDSLNSKERQGRQIKANALWEGSSSPGSERARVGVFFATDAPELAVDGAMRRMKLDVPYPEAVLALYDAEGQRKARVFGYSDSTLASELSASLGVGLEEVPRPGYAGESRTAVTLDAEELERAVVAFPNIVLQGPPGTGKSSLALELVRRLTSRAGDVTVDECRFGHILSQSANDVSAMTSDPMSVAMTAPVVWEMVQLHPGYAYDDLVRRIAPTSTDGDLQFVVEERLLPKMCALAEKRGPSKPVILILDELNRCNLPAVLGEFIFAIDPGHRSTPVRLQYQSAGLPASIAVPPNLWIIGTMNTADRSIALVDYAIRRRFRFLDVPADAEVISKWYASKPELGDVAGELFDAANLGLERNVMVGHAAFLVQPSPNSTWAGRIARQFAYHVAPLLLEYAREGLRAVGPIRWGDLELDPAQSDTTAQVLEAAIAGRV